MSRPRKRTTYSGPPRAIGYVRVSTDKQVDSGAGLADQRAKLEAKAAAEGWTLEIVGDPGISAAEMRTRPALLDAIERIEAGEADILVGATLARLCRDLPDFAGLMKRARLNGWRLVCLDVAADTDSPTGELQAHMVAAFAQYERRLIGERTKAALAVKRAQGVRLGRPQTLPLDVVNRIVTERVQGETFQSIADGLTRDGIPTARGGVKWGTSSVQAVITSQAAAPLLDLARETFA